MKIKQKFKYTKQKKVKFTQTQWQEAMDKAIKEHPELAEGLDGVKEISPGLFEIKGGNMTLHTGKGGAELYRKILKEEILKTIDNE